MGDQYSRAPMFDVSHCAQKPNAINHFWVWLAKSKMNYLWTLKYINIRIYSVVCVCVCWAIPSLMYIRNVGDVTLTSMFSINFNNLANLSIWFVPGRLLLKINLRSMWIIKRNGALWQAQFVLTHTQKTQKQQLAFQFRFTNGHTLNYLMLHFIKTAPPPTDRPTDRPIMQ